ncbi:hypothetical protein [Neobacillus niacini]|uniref:hypothetical protein n=1 Tax=Neobacillus niacini TaxID=86668 RepID=UPI002FFF0BD7
MFGFINRTILKKDDINRIKSRIGKRTVDTSISVLFLLIKRLISSGQILIKRLINTGESPINQRYISGIE